MFVKRKECLTFAAKNQKKTVFMAFQASFYFYGFYFYFAKKAERDAVCQTKTIWMKHLSPASEKEAGFLVILRTETFLRKQERFQTSKLSRARIY